MQVGVVRDPRASAAEMLTGGNESSATCPFKPCRGWHDAVALRGRRSDVRSAGGDKESPDERWRSRPDHMFATRGNLAAFLKRQV